VCVCSPPLQGGFTDNNKGMDYHVQVTGGTGTMPSLRVVHVASEMAPIAKVGCAVDGWLRCGWMDGFASVPL
jgi:hypothetical protein